MVEYIEKAMTFGGYEKLLDELVVEGKTTGPNQTEALAGFTRLNRHRMSRLDKTVEVIDELKAAAHKVTLPMIWLVITEGWCGDAAQNVPVIEKIAAESDKIETRYVLRDENPELMDQYLTGESRSIPKLIALDAATLEVLGSWGARPALAQQLFSERKAAGIEKAEILEEMQRWYNADKGRSLQKEFVTLLREWSSRKAATAVN